MSTAEISEGSPQERRTPPDAQAFIDMQASPEFQELRTRLRKFVFPPITAFFLLWYAVYVVLATYAHDFMATKVLGNINLGIILGSGNSSRPSPSPRGT